MAAMPYRTAAQERWRERDEFWESLTETLDQGSGDFCSSVQTDSEKKRRPDWLAKIIEGEIIPRLMLAHSAAPAAAVAGKENSGTIKSKHVTELTERAVALDANAAFELVEELRLGGISLEDLFLGLLAPAARRLGEQWEEDKRSFAEVTIGLTRLHRIVREFGPAFEHEEEISRPVPCALLSPSAGEQHVFGLALVEEFLRRAGWHVADTWSDGDESLLAAVRRDRFDVVGLSLSTEDRLDDVAGEIRDLRKASCNPDVGVLVGGRAFAGHPERAVRVGADACASDAKDAVLQADRLLDICSGRCSLPGSAVE